MALALAFKKKETIDQVYAKIENKPQREHENFSGAWVDVNQTEREAREGSSKRSTEVF